MTDTKPAWKYLWSLLEPETRRLISLTDGYLWFGPWSHRNADWEPVEPSEEGAIPYSFLGALDEIQKAVEALPRVYFDPETAAVFENPPEDDRACYIIEPRDCLPRAVKECL